MIAKRFGFTVAEVIITIGVVGYLATLTIPPILKAFWAIEQKAEFKKVLSTWNEILRNAQTDIGALNCFYWTSSPYGPAYCAEYTADNSSCKKYLMKADNSPLPSNYNGERQDCTAFKSWFVTHARIAKTCMNNAYDLGCIPDYKGIDTLKTDSGSTEEQALLATVGTGGFRKSSILKSNTAYVFQDGSNVVLYGSSFAAPVFLIDINGKRKPNKWGYDLFSFIIRGSSNGSIKLGCADYGYEKGGKSCSQLIKDVFK